MLIFVNESHQLLLPIVHNNEVPCSLHWPPSSVLPRTVVHTYRRCSTGWSSYKGCFEKAVILRHLWATRAVKFQEGIDDV